MKAMGTLILGLISIVGLVFFKEATLLSIAGILIGMLSVKETKPSEQARRKLAGVGIGLNVLGFIWGCWLIIF